MITANSLMPFTFDPDNRGNVICALLSTIISSSVLKTIPALAVGKNLIPNAVLLFDTISGIGANAVSVNRVYVMSSASLGTVT